MRSLRTSAARRVAGWRTVTAPAASYPEFTDHAPFKRALKSVAARQQVSEYADQRRQVLEAAAAVPDANLSAIDVRAAATSETPVARANRRFVAMSTVAGHIVSDAALFAQVALNLDASHHGASRAAAVTLLQRVAAEGRRPVPAAVVAGLAAMLDDAAGTLQRLVPALPVAVGQHVTSPGRSAVTPNAQRAGRIASRVVQPTVAACVSLELLGPKTAGYAPESVLRLAAAAARAVGAACSDAISVTSTTSALSTLRTLQATVLHAAHASCPVDVVADAVAAVCEALYAADCGALAAPVASADPSALSDDEAALTEAREFVDAAQRAIGDESVWLDPRVQRAVGLATADPALARGIALVEAHAACRELAAAARGVCVCAYRVGRVSTSDEDSRTAALERLDAAGAAAAAAAAKAVAGAPPADGDAIAAMAATLLARAATAQWALHGAVTEASRDVDASSFNPDVAHDTVKANAAWLRDAAATVHADYATVAAQLPGDAECPLFVIAALRGATALLNSVPMCAIDPCVSEGVEHVQRAATEGAGEWLAAAVKDRAAAAENVIAPVPGAARAAAEAAAACATVSSIAQVSVPLRYYVEARAFDAAAAYLNALSKKPLTSLADAGGDANAPPPPSVDHSASAALCPAAYRDAMAAARDARHTGVCEALKAAELALYDPFADDVAFDV